MKIAYCGYDFYSSCLEALLANGHEILRVFSFPCDRFYTFNDYLRAISKRHGIVFTEEKITSRHIAQLQAQQCDVLICAAYLYKVPVLEGTGIKGMNIHPALLPVGRGRWPLPWFILKKHSESGTTIHKLSDEYDAGDVILQESFMLDDDECYESLACKFQLQAVPMLLKVLADFNAMWDNATPQRNEQSQYWPLPDDENRTLRWRNGVEQLDRQSRAFGKYGCQAYFNEAWHIVYVMKTWRQAHSASPGEVVHKTNTEMLIAVSDGYACLRYFKPMSQPGEYQA